MSTASPGATVSLDPAERAGRLHAIARAYVTEGLGKGSFAAIPYHPDVVLRAPLAPGGVHVPLVGRDALRTVWWPPLPQLVQAVRVIDSFVSADLTAAAVEFHLDISNPPCTLRIVDRFTINAAGEIVEQENYFDPRDLTHPGWRTT